MGGKSTSGKIAIGGVVAILLLVGCIEQAAPERTYICPDGTEAASREGCASHLQPGANIPALPMIGPAAATPAVAETPGPTTFPKQFHASQEMQAAWEKEIFIRINAIRVQNNLSMLDWNGKVAQVARDYSKKLAQEGTIRHKDTEGFDVGGRLKAAGVIYAVANENLIVLPVDEGADFAEQAVNAWMQSPGHRGNIVDVDQLYTSGGVGVTCVPGGCYSVYSAVATGLSHSGSLKPGYGTFAYVLDPGLGFGKGQARIFVNSSEPLSVTYVLSHVDFDRWAAGVKYDYTWAEGGLKSFYRNVNASSGEGLIIVNNNEVRAVNYTVKVDYET